MNESDLPELDRWQEADQQQGMFDADQMKRQAEYLFRCSKVYEAGLKDEAFILAEGCGILTLFNELIGDDDEFKNASIK